MSTSLKPVSATNLPQTLLGAASYFSDPNTCFRFLVNLRWKEGVTCPHCEANGVTCKDVRFHEGKRKLWRCYGVQEAIQHQGRDHL
jgi:hypothetical protein